MSQCTSCGSHVPNGQRSCSMCYGDIDHGRDGYYREWAEGQERDRADRAEQERQQEDAQRERERDE